jgi:F0F1-type ATP synthase gamma subunit
MVSAAKLKKAQDAITAMRPYAEKWNYYKTFLRLLKEMWEESIQRSE